MGRDLKELCTLSEQMLLEIQHFLMSDPPDNSESRERIKSQANKWLTDDDEGTSGMESDNMDAEDEAGVIDWADFSGNMGDSEKASNRKENKDLKKITKNSRWLQGSLISVVGNMDLLVFAHAQKIVVVEKNPSENVFQIIGQFNTADPSWTPPAYIRCMCVLPMSCTRKTETSLYDWSVVIVGMSNGFVRYYTERGRMLRSDHVANSPIEEIRLGKSVMAGNQELCVLSQNDLTCVEGLSLYVALKAAKTQLARGETDLEKIAANAKLNFEKLKFEPGFHTVDFGVSGPLKATWFDLHVAATLSANGCNAIVERTSLPVYSTYVFVGRSPYVGFGWYTPSASQNILADALYSLGSQLTTSVASSIPSFGMRSFLGIGVSRKDRPPPNPPIVEAKPSGVIPMRSTITDGKREGERIYMAPSKYKLAAVTDSLARVVLIDIDSRHIIRMWKGYRDARCAWLESMSVLERNKSRFEIEEQPSMALFLVIFAPRRGLLEAWSMQNGGRVFASKVDRRGRLIGVPRLSDHLLGCDERAAAFFPSVFFMSSEGKIYQLWIPFHLALSDENGSAIHDSSIIREIDHLIKDGSIKDLSTWLQFFCALRTVRAMKESLETLWRDCEIDCSRLCSLMSSVQQHVENHPAVSKSSDGNSLLIYISTIIQLLDVYTCLIKMECEEPNKLTAQSDETDIARRLFIDKENLDLCLKRIAEYRRGKDYREEKNLSFAEFLLHFDLSQTALAASNRRRLKNVLLKKTPALGRFLFHSVLTRRCEIQRFMDCVISKLGLSGVDIAAAFCGYWLSPRADFAILLPRVLNLCERLSEMDSSLMTWLDKVERSILDSQELGSALSLCLVARAIALSQRHASLSKDDGNGSGIDESHHDDWDHVELTLEWWDLLFRHLQCMIVLKGLPGKLRICLADLINDGPAYYREQIGKWTVEFSLDPLRLYDILDDPTTADSHIVWEITISELRKLFPLSLSPEFVICDCAWECISAWRRRKDKNGAYDLLDKAVKFVELLGKSGRLQHGMCAMLWDTFLRQPFRYLYDFLSRKSSHYKKLEDCRIDVKRFPVYCTKVLQMLRSSVHYAEEAFSKLAESSTNSNIFANDNLFEDFVEAVFEFQRHKQTKPKKPLSCLAGQQKPVNFPLVCHHHILAMVIELQMSLEEWPPGPKHFFDSIGERAFFESFYAHPLIPMENVTEGIRKRRMEFLKKCVAHRGSPEFTDPQRFHIYDLAYDWRLDIDEIKGKEVITLFQKGLDSEAEQILSVMENCELLPYELFNVAVARVRNWFDRCEKDLKLRGLRMSLISDRMLKCIRDSKMEVVTVSPDDTLLLMQRVRMCLGRVQSNDRTVEIDRLALQFEKLIATIK